MPQQEMISPPLFQEKKMTLSLEELVSPTDVGVLLLIDELIEKRRHTMARKLLRGRSASVQIYPANKGKTKVFIQKLIEEAKGLSREPAAPDFWKTSASSFLASVDGVSHNLGAKNPGWLEVYSKFSSSFLRFARIHLQKKVGV